MINRKVQAECVDPRRSGVMVKRERSPSPSPSFAPSVASKRSFTSGNRPPIVKRRDSSMALTETTPREGSIRPMSSAAVKKEVYGEVETRNRAELAKIVVVGMRACGLRDYRNSRGRTVVAGEEDGDGGREREREKEREKEEYKQVYYHTVKAVAFAFVGSAFFPWFFIWLVRVGVELTVR